MFQRLRNKFLILHMGIVILLMVVFFLGILIINYQNIESRSIKALEEESIFHQRNPLPMQGRMFINQRLVPSFSVEITQDNKLNKIFSIYDMDNSFYEGLTNMALARKSEKGKIVYDGAHFRFLKVGSRIIFLEITKDIDTLYNMTLSILWVAIPMVVIIFLISLYFANKSIKPIEGVFNKQKEFIADASHELKTPIATISTNTDVLIEMAGAEQLKWLSYIKTEAKRMENLTNSLLYLTKMEYDTNTKKEFSKVNFSDILENYLMAIEAVIFEKKITSEVNITPEIYVEGNSEQLKRLTGILLDNAIKYTAGKITVTLIKEQNEAKLSVFNTGEGICEEELKRIWDRFYRVDKSREHIGGFGLGLPIAKAVALEHNGKIHAESKLSEWTRFTVTLPLVNGIK